MNIFRGIRRDSIGSWDRQYQANRTDYVAAVIAIAMVIFAIVGPVARGAL